MPRFNLCSLAHMGILGPTTHFLSEGMFGLDAIWVKLFLHESPAAVKSKRVEMVLCGNAELSLPPSHPATHPCVHPATQPPILPARGCASSS